MANGKNGVVRTWTSVAAVVVVVLAAAVGYGVMTRTVRQNCQAVLKLEKATTDLPSRVVRNERDLQHLSGVSERLAKIEGTLELILKRLP